MSTEDVIQKCIVRTDKIFESLPENLKTQINKDILRSIALDFILLRDMSQQQALATEVKVKLQEFEDKKDRASLNELRTALDAYYLDRRDAGEFEHRRMEMYSKYKVSPIFVLSYGRWEHNATLAELAHYKDPELDKQVTVFVQKNQVERYKEFFPQFNYHGEDVDTVGARFMAVLDYCKEHNIKRPLILEDEISRIGYLKKGGVDYNSKCNMVAEEYGSAVIKYWQTMGGQLFDEDPDCVLVGLRNRACNNSEQTSIIGYQNRLRGGCPNQGFLIDLDRFYDMYKAIPKEHYTPQYDWAIHCSIIKNNKNWRLLTAIFKGEVYGPSVISYKGDREAVAKEMLKYYGVEDKFKITVIRSKKGSLKLTYNGGFEKCTSQKSLF